MREMDVCALRGGRLCLEAYENIDADMGLVCSRDVRKVNGDRNYVGFAYSHYREYLPGSTWMWI